MSKKSFSYSVVFYVYDCFSYKGEPKIVMLSKEFNIDKMERLSKEDFSVLENVNLNTIKFICVTIKVNIDQFGEIKSNSEILSNKFNKYTKSSFIINSSLFVIFENGVNLTYNEKEGDFFIIRNLSNKENIKNILIKINSILN